MSVATCVRKSIATAQADVAAGVFCVETNGKESTHTPPAASLLP